METIYITELEHKGNLRIVVEVHTSTDGFCARKPAKNDSKKAHSNTYP